MRLVDEIELPLNIIFRLSIAGPYAWSSVQKWFSNPMNEMIDSGSDKQQQGTLVSRLHAVLRPFLLRRLKKDVEQQMPRKVEHIVPCRLSKRQRHLYEEFITSAETRYTSYTSLAGYERCGLILFLLLSLKLASGNYLSIANVLMQLRKVCNHPALFEERPIISSFNVGHGIILHVPSLVVHMLAYVSNGVSPPQKFYPSILTFFFLLSIYRNPWVISISPSSIYASSTMSWL